MNVHEINCAIYSVLIPNRMVLPRSHTAIKLRTFAIMWMSANEIHHSLKACRVTLPLTQPTKLRNFP